MLTPSTNAGSQTCKDKKLPNDEGWTACNCPIRVKGRLKQEKSYVRKACKTTTWSAAVEIARYAEECGQWTDPDDLVTNGSVVLHRKETFGTHERETEAAKLASNQPDKKLFAAVIDAFIDWKQSDQATRRVSHNSVQHFYSLFGHPDSMPAKPKQKPRTAPNLKSFLAANGMLHGYQIENQGPKLAQWTLSWRCGKHQHGLRIGRVVEFFDWCVSFGHMKSNPALSLLKLKPVITSKDHRQRQSFEKPVLKRILDAASGLPRTGNGVIVGNAEIEALILLTLLVGPGLAGASALNARNLSEDPESDGARSWTYNRVKNGVRVDTAIPPYLVRKLRALPKYKDGFFFFNGSRQTKGRTHVLATAPE